MIRELLQVLIEENQNHHAAVLEWIIISADYHGGIA
jgi:uncharacterized Rmd1/YagE family protein